MIGRENHENREWLLKMCIRDSVMTLTTGKKIPVPKARYAQVKREYMLYKGCLLYTSRDMKLD